MNWKLHLAFGVVLGFLVAYFAFNESLIGMLLFAGISGVSALLPDLDLRKSKASKLAYGIVFVLIIGVAGYAAVLGNMGIEWFFVLALCLLGAFAAIDWFLRPKHRGIMHSILFLAIAFAAALFLFGLFAASAVFVGYFSHLVLDRQFKLV